MSDAAQRTFVRVAGRNEVAPGTSLVVNVGRYDVALFNVDGEMRAYENACPHQGGPIGEGWIEAGVVTCPWHAWRFDLLTGAMTLGDFARLRRFEARVELDGVSIATEPELE
jgi:nitrite reductase/ring-hydroxylating ferredoxin subunit